MGVVVAGFTALTFPADDVVFAERVRETLDAVLRESNREDAERLLVSRLRTIHPFLTTSRRTPLAGFGEDALYVFRDGSASSSSYRDESWVGAHATARVVTDEAGRYIEANEAAAELFGVSADEMLGREAGTFTRPDARLDAAALWHALATTGRLHSLAILR